MDKKVSGTAGYGEKAAALIAQYESITFEDAHQDVLHLIPAHACKVLDVGAGSGRDAAALARKGHAVVAVEPTRELREEGQRHHRMANIEWVDDHLPSLSATGERGQGFHLIFLTAVWMHLDADEREKAINVLSDLLLPRGKMFMTLRHGPVPEGRKMFAVSAEETTRLAGVVGLHRRHISERSDMFDRQDVSWSHLVFEKMEQDVP